LKKWRKVIIGTALFAGFALYTQYEKNAEPVWKVNAKEFTVVNTLQEGMKREYIKFDELEVVDNYDFLQEVNKTIQLKEEYRTLKIEKIWNLQGRLYFLYSVDLKERDKDETDVPRITVKKMKLSAKNGNESVFTASENSGNPGTRDEGFVYKHRLYRSMMAVPVIVDNEQMDWELLTYANRIELQEVAISDKEGSKPLKNIAFKVSSENIFLKVLESSPINKQFTYGNSKKADIKSYEVLLYDRRFSLSIPDDDNELTGFLGYKNNPSESFVMDIIGTESQGYYIPFYEDLSQLDNANIEKSITIHSSLHKNDRSYMWTIPKEDIQRFNKNADRPLIKNEEIVNQNNLKIIYEGLSTFNGGPTIKISVISSNNNDSKYINLVPENYYGYDKIPEEYTRSYQKNLLTITNEKKEKLGNFNMFNEESDSKHTFYINFHKEDQNEGPINPISIPEENLTITLSDLVHPEPLSSPVIIKYKVPEMKVNMEN
jgi:hypothetical protein